MANGDGLDQLIKSLIKSAGGTPGIYGPEIEYLVSDRYTSSFYTFLAAFFTRYPTVASEPDLHKILTNPIFQAQVDEFLGLLVIREEILLTLDPSEREELVKALTLRTVNESEVYVEAFTAVINPNRGQPSNEKTDVEAVDTTQADTITIDGEVWTNIQATLMNDDDIPPEAFDWIDQNRQSIINAYKEARHSGLVGSTRTFQDWVVNIYAADQLALAVERSRSVRENGHDPIIDPLITSMFAASNLGGSEIDTVLRKVLKESINEAITRGDFAGANKEILFDRMGPDAHKNTITSTLEIFFKQAEGGEAFIEALEGRGITLGSLIFDPTWATEVPDDLSGIPAYPDAFDSLTDFIEAVNTWATTTYPDIPSVLEPPDVKRLDETKFILDEFKGLAGFPAYIRDITVGIIQNSLQTSGLELLTVENAADVSSWLNDQGGLDAFLSEAVIVALGTVDGGDRLLSQLQAKGGQALGDAFIDYWTRNMPPSATAFTQVGFSNALIHNDLIPPEPEDPDDALEKMINSDFAGIVRPLVSGLPSALRSTLIHEAESYFRDEITLGGGMEADQVMDQEGFEPGLEIILDSVVSNYFGNDELTGVFIEGLEGGVREFFKIFPGLTEVPPQEIIRQMHDGEIRPTPEVSMETAADFNEMLADEKADIALEERFKDVAEGLAEVDLIADEQVLDWLEKDPKGIEVAEALAAGRITDLMQQAEDLATAADQKGIRDSADQIEFENLKRAVSWLTSTDALPFGDDTITGQEYSKERFTVDQQQKLLDLREDLVALPERERMVTFWESPQGKAILAAETAQDIQDIIDESARRATESEAARQEFDQLQRAVEYFKTSEGQQLIEDEFAGEIQLRLQKVSQLTDQLDFQRLEFELKKLDKPRVEYQLGIAGTRVGQALGLAEEEQAFRGRLESLFMPELQRVAEQQFGRAQAADVLRTLPQDQFQRFFSEIQQEVEREQLTGLKRFDPDVIMHPEGRLLGPEEKIDYYTPEAFVSRVFEQPEVVEKARRAGRLERLRPFRAPVAGRQRRRLLGGRRSFARAGRPIPA